MQVYQGDGYELVATPQACFLTQDGSYVVTLPPLAERHDRMPHYRGVRVAAWVWGTSAFVSLAGGVKVKLLPSPVRGHGPPSWLPAAPQPNTRRSLEANVAAKRAAAEASRAAAYDARAQAATTARDAQLAVVKAAALPPCRDCGASYPKSANGRRPVRCPPCRLTFEAGEAATKAAQRAERLALLSVPEDPEEWFNGLTKSLREHFRTHKMWVLLEERRKMYAREKRREDARVELERMPFAFQAYADIQADRLDEMARIARKMVLARNAHYYVVGDVVELVPTGHGSYRAHVTWPGQAEPARRRRAATRPNWLHDVVDEAEGRGPVEAEA